MISVYTLHPSPVTPKYLKTQIAINPTIINTNMFVHLQDGS